jgi:tRNA threonylcarbamoyl adenosine modification protein YeaZ
LNLLLINSNENDSFAAAYINNEFRVVRTSEFLAEIERPGRSPDKLINCLVKLRSIYDISILDAISVTIGPGSFTGIRVGLALAKGIAGALSKQLIPINNFVLQYERISDKAGDKKYCILIPAKYPEYYYSIFHYDKQESSGCLSIDEISSILAKNTIIAGNFDNESDFKHSYFAYLNLKNSAIEENEAMLELSKRYYDEGRLANPEDIEPVYIKEFGLKK